jgi:DNA-binding transcriptional MocR family regulator
VRTALRERVRVLGETLRAELPDAQFEEPEGGYFMWVELPGTDIDALFDAAKERGVLFVKGSDFMLDGAENALRLAYSGVTVDEIREGVALLGEAARSLPRVAA